MNNSVENDIGFVLFLFYLYKLTYRSTLSNADGWWRMVCCFCISTTHGVSSSSSAIVIYNFKIRRHRTQTYILSRCPLRLFVLINLIKSRHTCLVRMCHCFTLTATVYRKYCSTVWLAVQLSVLSGLNNCCNTENKWIHTSPVERTDPYSHFYLVCGHLVRDY